MQFLSFQKVVAVELDILPVSWIGAEETLINYSFSIYSLFFLFSVW